MTRAAALIAFASILGTNTEVPRKRVVPKGGGRADPRKKRLRKLKQKSKRKNRGC